MNQRLYKFDNIRFLLMFLVILGHLLEVIHSEVGSQLYRVIYSFHMPLFIFVSGYFAKYDRRKILINFIYPYLLFQSLYCFFFRPDGEEKSDCNPIHDPAADSVVSSGSFVLLFLASDV